MLRRPWLGLVLAVALSAAERPQARAVVDVSSLPAIDRARVERAIEIATSRYDEWLGASTSSDASALGVDRRWWSSPSSMDLESQAAFELARRRFSRLDPGPLVDGIAWHLQSRVTEELFDYAVHQPGHHAEELRLFGDHVRWGIPLLVLPRHARDGRSSPAVRHAADAVATLEGLVGWPSLAAALRVVASDDRARLDGASVKEMLESALAVPLDWFFTALDPAFSVNYRLASVVTRPQQCEGTPCYETTMAVARDGAALLPVPITIEFGADQGSTIWWSGSESSREFAVQSGIAPAAITLDPGRRLRLDDTPLDQRWLSEPIAHARPIKTFTSWVIWLQHAMLTYDALL